MKKIRIYVFNLIILTPLLTAFLSPAASFAATCDTWVAKAVSVQGRVEVRKSGETQWQPVKLNDTYCPGDMIRVPENSRADIALINQPLLRLDQNTTITLGGLKEERTSLVELVKGAAHFFSRLPRSLDVRTAFVNAGVEGTEGTIRVDDEKTVITIFEGKVIAANEAGSLALTGGQSAAAEKGKAPVMTVVVKPRDAVRWALYYPAVIYTAPGGAPVSGDSKDPRVLVNQAAALLNVGRVDEAKAAIAQALSRDPNAGDAYALQSVIAVAQNDKDQALDLAKQAVEKAPRSATARIALSYAQQARFDLDGARASLEEAVRLEPANALAWARLAELWSSAGDLDKSLAAAKKAAELDPQVSRTQTVLGFAYLTQVKTSEAKVAFEKAIELDQAAPLPRLGLGLAKIREGNLPEGGREIEIAASLDPNNSLIRSYLGKVYYEEKREKIDGQEYAIAKELDPQDPTPWFYDAIAKQTMNRPVEALQDLQKAIRLNDNRAVYRSRLLLDSDLAARSASLARIYSDLGFQELALVEGWKSVNTDPTNFSAHRFLADSYAVLPRHEIARVSELLQSQLLQPINSTPIQPRLAESNQFLTSGAGPSGLSFNEFNPLFNRDQVGVQASGIVGGNATRGGEAVVSGIYNRASFSLGGSRSKTDGFRTNNGIDDDVANAFAQVELSNKTSLQAEYRFRDTQKGDLALRFFPNEFRPNEKQTEKTNSIRLGARHTFSPGSVLLGSFMSHKRDASLHDKPTSAPFINSIDITTETKATSGEVQHLFRSKLLNVASGLGYFKTDRKDDSVTDLNFPPPPFGPGRVISKSTTDLGIKHINVYLYSQINLHQDVTLSLGVSGDFFDKDSTGASGNESEKKFNPKFGFTWTPVSTTTVRGAVFRTMKRTLITDQTLEPTQVAGFNQFYDDADRTDAWRYGLAIDQKFSSNLYGGVEYSWRKLDVPFFDQTAPPPTPPTWKQADWKENLGRAYLFWTPHDWLALTLEYQRERFEKDEKFVFDGVKDLTTHRVPLGINFFHPSGISAMVKTTYVNQQGNIQPDTPPPHFEDVSENFYLVDLALRYRLPKRYGFITVGARNLLDKEFRYQDMDPDSPSIQPKRFLYGAVTLAFP